jgi:hypothetical protein
LDPLFFSLLSVISVANLSAQPTTAPAIPPAFQIVGHIDAPRLDESSGLVASRRYPGVFWTHNDSGNPAAIFAITRRGKVINEFPVQGKNVDWEDIAFDAQDRLYLADIGNNNCDRKQVQVYRVAEPDPRGAVHLLQPDKVWKLTHPAKPFDAESLFILGNDAYIIAKYLDGQEPGMYRFSLLDNSNEPIRLERVHTLALHAPVTAADISRDGKLLAVMTLLGPVVYRIDGDPTRATRENQIFSAMFIDPNIEGVCFVSDGLLATTEGRRVVSFPFTDSPDSR